MARANRYWLVKSEPSSFSFDDLVVEPGGTAPWDGIRNYQARNFLREMRKGDKVLFYHSQVTPPGVVGVAEVASNPHPDPTQFDPSSKYYDPKSTHDAPRWDLVDIRAVRKLDTMVTLAMIKSTRALADMKVAQRGSRLSVMPVTKQEFETVLKLAGARAGSA